VPNDDGGTQDDDNYDNDFEKDDLVNVAPPRAPKQSKNSKMARYEKTNERKR
jgi:hypothetical protein